MLATLAPDIAAACSCAEPDVEESDPAVVTIPYSAVAENETLPVTILDAAADLRLRVRVESGWLDLGPLGDQLERGHLTFRWSAGDEYQIVLAGGATPRPLETITIGPALIGQQYFAAPILTDEGVREISYSDSSCSTIHDSRVQKVGVELPDELRPYLERVRWRVEVDGRRGFHSFDACSEPSEAPPFVVATKCDPFDAERQPGIAQVEVSAIIVGSDATLTTGTFEVDQRCEQEGGACSTSGGNQTWPAALLLAGFVVRRRRRGTM